MWTCGGAENDPVADMAGEGLLRGNAGDVIIEDVGGEEPRYLFKNVVCEGSWKEGESTVFR